MNAQKKSLQTKLRQINLIMVAVLSLGALWTILTRVPDSSRILGEPPPNPKTGFSAPDFTLETLTGDTLVLSDLRGQSVVLNLWATWCLPCRSEMPAIQRAYERYKDEGLVFIGLNMTAQDSEPDVRRFAQELGLTFPIVLDPNGSAGNRYQLLGLPSTYFIDTSGVIRDVVVGGPMSEAALRSRIEDLLEGK